MLLHGDEVTNEGGQLWPLEGADHPPDLAALKSEAYQFGSVTAHGFGPDAIAPRYSHVSGDITRAYSSAKASKVTRSFVTFSTSQPDWPAIVISYDRVSAKDAQFPKTWLVHSIQEPQVEGNTISIVRDGPSYDGKHEYGGKLVLESLLPENASVKKVGGPGKEFWIESNQTNYAVTKAPPAEPGAWRVEISPSAAALEDRFLQAMTVLPSSSEPPAKATMIREPGVVGASISGWVALFSDSGALLSSPQFSLPAGQSYHVLINDMSPGFWYVKNDGATIASQWVTPEAKSLYFEGGAGEYTIVPGPMEDGGMPLDAGAGGGGGQGPADDAGASSSGGSDDSGGCGCRTTRGAPTSMAGLAGLVALAALARRKRRGGRARTAGNP